MEISYILRYITNRRSYIITGVAIFLMVALVTQIPGYKTTTDITSAPPILDLQAHRHSPDLDPISSNKVNVKVRQQQEVGHFLKTLRDLQGFHHVNHDVTDTADGPTEGYMFDGKSNISYHIHPRLPLAYHPEGTTHRLPESLVIGAPKAGTFTLKTFLGFHPDIVIPKLNEVNFFHNEENYKRGYEWYIRQMPVSSPGQLTLEKSPQYLYHAPCPERVYRMNKNIKLMLSVRSPLDRAVSCYLHKVHHREMDGKTSVPFEETVIDQETGTVDSNYSCIRTTLYSKYLARWLKYFPKAQIHVIDGDNLAENPVSEMRLIEQYLGVQPFFKESMFQLNEDTGFYCFHLEGEEDYCMPSSKGRPHPEVNLKAKKKLLSFFKPYNDILYEMVERNLNWATSV